MSLNAVVLGSIQASLEVIVKEYPTLDAPTRGWRSVADEKRKSVTESRGREKFSLVDLRRLYGALEEAIENHARRTPIVPGLPALTISGEPLLPEEVLDFFYNSRALIKNRSQVALRCKIPRDTSEFTFKNISGLLYEKQQIYTLWILPQRYPGIFKRHGNSGGGVLLYGPPGTGKTLLARATATELQNVAFFSVTAGELKDKYIGETEKNIKAIFDCAIELIEGRPDKYTSAIIFIDEFDALGAPRDGPDPYAKDATNALLIAMDGLGADPRISVVAATNKPDNIDDGLIRRFNRLIFVDLPDRAARIGTIADTIVKALCPPDWKPAFDGDFMGYGLGRDVKLPGGTEFDYERSNSATRMTWTAIKTYTTDDPDDEKDAVIDILKVATLTGPSKEANSAELIWRRTGDKEFYPKGETRSKLGYSGSDITKMLEVAFSKAGLRSIANRKNKNFVKATFGSKGEYYVYTNHKELLQARGGGYSLEEIDKAGLSDRVLNFTLLMSDIEAALAEYPATTKESLYKEIVKWKP